MAASRRGQPAARRRDVQPGARAGAAHRHRGAVELPPPGQMGQTTGAAASTAGKPAAPTFARGALPCERHQIRRDPAIVGQRVEPALLSGGAGGGRSRWMLCKQRI